MNFQLTHLICIVGLTLLTHCASGQENQCSSRRIGTQRSTSSVNRDDYFYINAIAPSDCWGTISSFSYCYYAPTGHRSGRIYRTNFGVYRPSTEGGSTVYNLVSRVLTIDRSQSQVDSELEYDDKRRRRYISHYDGGRYKRNDDYENNDICNTFSLSEPVVVNPGDVLGACVFDPPDSNIYPLHMVRSDSSSYVLLRADPVTSGCTDTAIPSSISEGSLSDRTSRTLHLYATIVPLPPTDPPTTQPATTAAPTTEEPTTAAPTTQEPTTAAPTTEEPTTAAPTTQEPTTTTQEPTTAAPTTQEPTSAALTTQEPTTAAPTTPTTQEPTTAALTTQEPTTAAPTTQEPTTTTQEPTTTTQEPTTPPPMIEEPTTSAPMTEESTTPAPTMKIPATVGPTVGSTTVGIGGSDSQQGGNNDTIAAVLGVILIVVIAAIVISIVVVVYQKRNKKKAKFSVLGIENVTYSPNKARAVAINADYDDITVHNTFSMVNPDPDLEHDYEDEFEFANAANAATPLYDNSYAEVGPFDESVAMEPHYLSPLDAPAIRFSDLLEKNKEKDIYDHLSPYQAPATASRELYRQLNSWGTRSIPRSEIEVVGHLGSGQFGDVKQGVWRREGLPRPVDVALKSLIKTSEENKVKFLQEAAIMAQFRHLNVLSLCGVVIQGEPILIVTEFVANSDLRAFLQTLKLKPGEMVHSNTPKLLLKFSQQVALGMQYLSAKGFVHRDLAARNILVTSDNICKIGHFGRSRDLSDEKYYISKGQDKVPVKWTAPEAIHYKKYSIASDVWSYGCLLYEIWSLGHKPFERAQTIDMVNFIDSGKRLPPPPGLPKRIYELMTICWHPKTMVRPSFRDIVMTLIGSEEMVLNIPEDDSSTNPLAGVLGAPLEAGENMYSELQGRYANYRQRAGVETDYDYFDVN